MSVRVLEGEYDGGETRAVMVCSVTGLAFGPLFDSGEELLAFLEWFKTNNDPGVDSGDPREYDPDYLADARRRFLADGANDG